METPKTLYCVSLVYLKIDETPSTFVSKTILLGYTINATSEAEALGLAIIKSESEVEPGYSLANKLIITVRND